MLQDIQNKIHQYDNMQDTDSQQKKINDVMMQLIINQECAIVK